MIPIKIYDSPTSDEPKADLDEAFGVTYTQKENEVWTAEFSLPIDDPHLDLIDGMDLAEVYDNGKRIELFQIMRKRPGRRPGGPAVTFELRHVLDYLNRDLVGEEQVYDSDLERYRNIQKTGMGTALSYILNQQSTQRWQLGTMDFSGNYTYEFFQGKLLNAVRKIPKVLWEDWQFEFDTTSYPWTLNIVSPDTTAQALIHYGKNMESIEQEADWSKLCTKVYAFGAGSGEDQIKVGPFTSDPEGYGTVEGTFSQSYFTTESGLTTAAQNWLEKHNTPLVRYEGSAADYKVLEGTNKFTVGDYVTVYDSLLDIESKVRVVRLTKNDVGDGSPLRYELNNSFQRIPDFGGLAFKESITENELEENSVRGGGGVGGALASGSVGEREADPNLELTYLNDSEEWGTRITANENGIATNVTDIDDNSSSITQNADRIQLLVSDINGNTSEILQTANQIALNVSDIDDNSSQIQVNQDEIDLRVKKNEVMSFINVTEKAVTINANDQIELKSGSSIEIDATDGLKVNAPVINITSLNDDGSWGSRISTNEDGISANVTDISGNETNITQNANNISSAVTDINNNSSLISQNATAITARVKEDELMSSLKITGQGIFLNASEQIALNFGSTLTLDGDKLVIDAGYTDINGQLDLCDATLVNCSVAEGGADKTANNPQDLESWSTGKLDLNTQVKNTLDLPSLSNLSAMGWSDVGFSESFAVGDAGQLATLDIGTGLGSLSGSLKVSNPFDPSGTYSTLRAIGTLAGDVGLGNVEDGADETASNPQGFNWLTDNLDLGSQVTGDLDLGVNSNLGAGSGLNISGASLSLQGDIFSETDTYSSLRAQGTQAGDVGLGNVEDGADITAGQFSMSLTNLENGSNYGLYIYNYRLPAEADADETGAHEGDVNCLHTQNAPKESNADETQDHVDKTDHFAHEVTKWANCDPVLNVTKDAEGYVTDVSLTTTETCASDVTPHLLSFVDTTA